ERQFQHYAVRGARRRRQQLVSDRPRRSDPADRPLPDREARPVQPRADPRARRPRQGRRSLRCLRNHRRRQHVHQGGPVPDRRRHRDAAALLLSRRRAGLPRHLARPPRLRPEVLHLRGQLRPRGQQHPRLLHPRRHQVPGLHPLAEAPARHQPARRRHAVGLLDPEPGIRAPGDLADGRPRPSRLLAHHERLRLAHLHVDQRGRREVLGQVPLQVQPGPRDAHGRRGRVTGRLGRRPPPARPLREHRQGQPPELGPQGPGHALRRRQGLPVQPVRPHQGLAAGRLPADPGRKAHAEPQPGELLRADRAGDLRAVELRARHRRKPRPHAAGAHLLLRRCAPLPCGHQPRPAAGEHAQERGAQLLQGRRGPVPLQLRLHPGVRAELGGRPRGRPGDLRPARRLGERRRARARRPHPARRGRRLRPGRHALPRGLRRRGPGPVPRDDHRRRRRRGQFRDPRAGHPVLDQRRRRPRCQAAGQPRLRRDPGVGVGSGPVL
ncbi:MAG: Catalase KatE, partial [uncultured Arthrobacter sp.]